MKPRISVKLTNISEKSEKWQTKMNSLAAARTYVEFGRHVLNTVAVNRETRK